MPHHIVVHLTRAHTGIDAMLHSPHKLVHGLAALMTRRHHDLELMHLTSLVTLLERIARQTHRPFAVHSRLEQACGYFPGSRQFVHAALAVAESKLGAFTNALVPVLVHPAPHLLGHFFLHAAILRLVLRSFKSFLFGFLHNPVRRTHVVFHPLACLL